MRNFFIARYWENEIEKSVLFNASKFTKEEAETYLKNKGIKNFLFFFEPYEPIQFSENSVLFRGEVGFDITVETLLPHIAAGKEIIINSAGGDLFTGWQIHDAIKLSGQNPSIGVLGICASSAVQIVLASENRWISENSKMLVHNPFTLIAGDDEDMKKMGAELEKEKLQLANKYAEISGRSLPEILQLMKDEKFLNAEESVSFNFAKTIKLNVEPLKNDEMENKEIAEKLSGFEAILNKIQNFFKPKNIVVSDVNGNELDFGETATAEEDIKPGAKATVQGAPANGEYVMPSGETYVFEAGELKEIKPAEGDGLEALKAENETLKSEIETLKNEKTEIANQFTEFKNRANLELQNLKADFAAFKNQFNPEPIDPPAPGGGQTKRTLRLKNQ